MSGFLIAIGSIICISWLYGFYAASTLGFGSVWIDFAVGVGNIADYFVELPPQQVLMLKMIQYRTLLAAVGICMLIIGMLLKKSR